MRVKAVHQSDTKSVFVVYNDYGVPVGRMTEPRRVDHEEADRMAREFRDRHPELFPGEKERRDRFDAMIEAMKPEPVKWWQFWRRA